MVFSKRHLQSVVDRLERPLSYNFLHATERSMFKQQPEING